MTLQICFFALAAVVSGLRLPAPGVGTLPRLAAGSASPVHPGFDPLGLHGSQRTAQLAVRSAGALAGAFPMLVCVGRAGAASSINLDADAVKRAIVNAAMDPSTFQPVCPASDGLYRFSGKLVLTIVGAENYKEYAPLIAGGLLRVRLELCVIESFVYEAVIPFVQEKGLSWILPLHETVETFLAGVIFAVASNFILIGSTKIVTVIATYADVLFGFPFRIVGAPPPCAHGPLRLAALAQPARGSPTGGLGWRALEDNAAPPAQLEEEKPKGIWAFFDKPPPRVAPPLEKVWKTNSGDAVGLTALVSFGALRAIGETSGAIRRSVESIDFFVGRYLLLTTVAYVGFKFVHYKLFDPFPL